PQPGMPPGGMPPAGMPPMPSAPSMPTIPGIPTDPAADPGPTGTELTGDDAGTAGSVIHGGEGDSPARSADTGRHQPSQAYAGDTTAMAQTTAQNTVPKPGDPVRPGALGA